MNVCDCDFDFDTGLEIEFVLDGVSMRRGGRMNLVVCERDMLGGEVGVEVILW